jgi:hypothetical protein
LGLSSLFEFLFLTTPLTFILSRKGREEKEEKILRKPLTLTLSRKVWLCHNPCFACDYAKNTVKNN